MQFGLKNNPEEERLQWYQLKKQRNQTKFVEYNRVLHLKKVIGLLVIGIINWLLAGRSTEKVVPYIIAGQIEACTFPDDLNYRNCIELAIIGLKKSRKERFLLTLRFAELYYIHLIEKTLWGKK